MYMLRQHSCYRWRRSECDERLEVVVATEARTRGMTREELLALPTAVDLDTANRALRIGRSTGYQLAKQGEYPVKVLRLRAVP